MIALADISVFPKSFFWWGYSGSTVAKNNTAQMHATSALVTAMGRLGTEGK